MKKFAPLVKRQIEYWRYQIAQYGPTHPRYRPTKIARYQQLATDFAELLEYLNKQEGTALVPETRDEAARAKPRFQPSEPSEPTQNTSPTTTTLNQPDDLSDLPPELLAELSGDAKAESDPLIKIIDKHGGIASMDQILIGLWRDHKEVGKRTVVGNKLYRLGKRGLVWSVAGKKGYYTTSKPEGVIANQEDKDLGNDEGPDASTSGPSSTTTGAAGLPEGPSKPSPVGSTPSASTKARRDLFASAAIPPGRVPR